MRPRRLRLSIAQWYIISTAVMLLRFQQALRVGTDRLSYYFNLYIIFVFHLVIYACVPYFYCICFYVNVNFSKTIRRNL